MQTVKHVAMATDAAGLAGPAADCSTIVREQSALFSTRLALARWTLGGDFPHLRGAGARLPLRTAWYARASRDFQEWIDGGGFHQHGEADSNAGPEREAPAAGGAAVHTGACIERFG